MYIRLQKMIFDSDHHENANLHYVFDAFEAFLFILPILPNSIYLRFAIIFGYFVGHVCKVQQRYLQIKNNILYDKYKNRDIDM